LNIAIFNIWKEATMVNISKTAKFRPKLFRTHIVKSSSRNRKKSTFLVTTYVTVQQ